MSRMVASPVLPTYARFGVTFVEGDGEANPIFQTWRARVAGEAAPADTVDEEQKP